MPDDNVEMIEHIARQPRNRDRAVFVGNLDDNVDDSFALGPPVIHEWSEFAGHVTGFNPASMGRRAGVVRRSWNRT